MRPWLFWLGICVAACASEVWDNPLDPQGSRYAEPCSLAPPDRKADCVLYDDFREGLVRWHVVVGRGGAPVVRSATGIRALELPACNGTALQREVAVPTGPLRLRLVWQSATGSNGVPRVDLSGLQQALASEPLALEPAWSEGVLDFDTGQNTRIELRLATESATATCHDVVRIREVEIRRR